MGNASFHDERFWTRYLARRAALCPACGYNLRGGRSPTCPECGRVTSLSELRQHADPTEEQWHMSGAWALSAAALFALIPGATLTILGAASLLGHRMTAISTPNEATFAVLFGLALTMVPVTLLWLWRRWARRMHRWPEFFKWTLVFFSTALALFCAMCALGTIALMG